MYGFFLTLLNIWLLLVAVGVRGVLAARVLVAQAAVAAIAHLLRVNLLAGALRQKPLLQWFP
jgi:hypothetical protein